MIRSVFLESIVLAVLWPRGKDEVIPRARVSMVASENYGTAPRRFAKTDGVVGSIRSPLRSVLSSTHSPLRELWRRVIEGLPGLSL